jgi:hypothetical protein
VKSHKHETQAYFYLHPDRTEITSRLNIYMFPVLRSTSWYLALWLTASFSDIKNGGYWCYEMRKRSVACHDDIQIPLLFVYFILRVWYLQWN